MSEGDFLSRWSRRKHEARRGEVAPEPVAPAAPAAAAVIPSQAGVPAQAVGDDKALPPVEALTPESDFAPFMQPNVDGALRRTALKTLFQDPRFNVMDGLDVYIDDYTKPDPLPEGWLEKLEQATHLGHYQPPPETAMEAAAATDDAQGAPRPPAETPAETPPETTAAQDSARPESETHSRS